MPTFRSPVNFRFANAIAAGASTPFAQKQFRHAMGVMIGNSDKGVVRLPLDVKAHVAFKKQAEETVAAQPDNLTIEWGPALPEAVMIEARKRQAQFEARNGPKPRRKRIGKTAKKGGRAAAERRKRERSAKDRALRDSMRGSSTKKK